MTELEGVMFFPDVSRYKRQRFYFYTFIFLKNNMQVHVWNVWICLYMLFVTFKVIKTFFSAFACGETWRGLQGALLIIVWRIWKSELEVLDLSLNTAILRTLGPATSFFLMYISISFGLCTMQLNW